MKLTGSQILMECFLEQGVDTVFGYPGGAVLYIYDELYKYSDKIKHILTSHEQGAAHAADGYARSSGKTGVCIATSGPGATNLVTGIATAYMDSVPVVFITGNVASPLIGRDSFQEADITGITMPITKNNYIVKDVNKLADTLREAFAIARSGRPGPVLVDIPKDISIAECEFENVDAEYLKSFERKGNKAPKIKDAEIEKLAEMIIESEKPYLLVGGGVLRSNAKQEVTKLAEMLNAPVGCTLMGLGGFASSDPKFVGMVGMHGAKKANIGINQCDLFISLGSRFSDRVTGDSSKFGKHAHFVHIDIDSAEIDKNIKTHHSIVGDIKEVLLALFEKLDGKCKTPEGEMWLNGIEKVKKMAPSIWEDNSGEVPNGLLTPKQIMQEIYQQTQGKSFIVTDVGQHQMWAAQYYLYDYPGKLITSGGFGTMGFGAGAAIGTSLANPGQPIIHIAGDGSFRMNCNELATEHHFNLPIITVIFNNGVLGMVRQWQTMFYESRYSNTDLDRGPDFVKLADAYGIKGYAACSVEELHVALAESMKSGKPAVINCFIGSDDKVVPMVAPGKPITDFLLE